ncbi:MAG: hypothetical protein ACOY0R_08115 [Chloroflexota bacterium]
MFRSNRILGMLFLALTLLLAACQPATPPPPLTASVGTEFTLAPGGSALIEEAGLTLTLIAVSSDERCPSKIECFASGPVTLSVSAQKGSGEATDLILQTFTSNDGLAPTMEFEGIQSQTLFEGYHIKVTSVLPYPARSMTEIADADYRVSFLVSLE